MARMTLIGAQQGVDKPQKPAKRPLRAVSATAGDTLVIYCTGLGEVNPSIVAGTPAPVSPLSHTVNTVTATMGGIAANVQFAGLTPGFAGLYQVNAVVPTGVTPGNQVPLILTAAGQSSVAVTIAVH